MGFFLGTPPKKARGKTALEKIKLSPELLAKAGCKACPLDRLEQTLDSPKMVPTGAKTPDIYIIGEAPGKNEDIEGRQFVGVSGKYLRPKLNPELRYRFNNTLRCRPPKNRTPEVIELACCMPKQIVDIVQTQPKVVLALGGVALEQLVGRGGITQWRGRGMALHLPGHSCWLVASFHPSYLLRTRQEGRDESEYDRAFDRDLILAEDLCGAAPPNRKLFNNPDGKVDVLLRPREIVAALEEIVNETTATDIETKNYRPYATSSAWLTASIATADRTIAFPIAHPEARLSPQDQKVIKTAYAKYLQRNKVIVQNASFEGEWFVHEFGVDKAYSYYLDDTMAQAFVLDERQGAMSLDDLSLQYFGIRMKQLASLNKMRLDQEPLQDVLQYNGRDSIFTLALWHEQHARLKSEGLVKVYKLQNNRCMAFVLAQYRGMNPNVEQLKAFESELTTNQAKLEQSIKRDQLVAKWEDTVKRKFKPGSPRDVLDLFKQNGLVDKDTKSSDEEMLRTIDHPIAADLLELRKLTKLYGTYVEPLIPGSGKQVHDDGLIHCRFNHLVTTTGRSSCVAKGTKIEIARNLSERKEVNIEDVRVGDWAYAYDDKLRPVLRRVQAVMYTGHREVVRVHWRSIGGKYDGFVDVTPEHPIRLTTGDWVRADSLKHGDAVMAVHRGGEPFSSGRPRLSFTGINTRIWEHQFVYSTVHRPYLRRLQNHVHHKDGDYLNNTPNNLQILSSNDHYELHPRNGTPIFTRIDISRFALLRQLAKAKGRWTVHNRQGDKFNRWTLRQRCAFYDLDPSLIKARYTKAGVFLSRGLVKRTVAEWGLTWAHRILNMDYYKFCNLVSYYGFSTPLKKGRNVRDSALQVINNHMIVSVEPLPDKQHVYDLTIDGVHNFIAGELNCHNSSDPNMQNFPKRGKGVVYRSVIRARRKHKLVAIDYGQIEYRVIGMATHDKAVCDSIWHGTDAHAYWARRLLDAFPRIAGGKKQAQDEKVFKEFRSKVKNRWTFPAFYGSGCYNISSSFDLTEQELSPLFQEFWQMFQGVKRWQKQQEQFANEYGYVECLTGRRRHMPMSYNALINSPIQGTASDIVVDGMERLSRYSVTEKEPWMHPVLNVHDDLTFDLPDSGEMEAMVEFICRQMLDCPFKFITLPLTVEVSIGDTWGTMEEVATLSSQDYGIEPPGLRRN